MNALVLGYRSAPVGGNLRGAIEAGNFMAKRSEKQEENKPLPLEYDDHYFEDGAAFLLVAQRYIGRGQRELSELQRLQMKLAEIIVESGPSKDWEVLLRKMIDLADRDLPQYERRWQAVQTIHQYGAEWKLPQWRASNETRRVCLTNMVNLLEAFDEGFALLRNDLDDVASKLDAYSEEPGRTPGAKGAERIIAEFIVEGVDALGFKVDSQAVPEGEVERIRDQLGKDCDKFLRQLNAAKNKP